MRVRGESGLSVQQDALVAKAPVRGQCPAVEKDVSSSKSLSAAATRRKTSSNATESYRLSSFRPHSLKLAFTQSKSKLGTSRPRDLLPIFCDSQRCAIFGVVFLEVCVCSVAIVPNEFRVHWQCLYTAETNGAGHESLREDR